MMSNIQYLRSGLRVRYEQGVNSRVRQACLNFAIWLRINKKFPIRCVVYIKKDYQIKTLDTKEMVSATFFAPYDKDVEPYIRVATGDYEELVSERGEEDAVFAILIVWLTKLFIINNGLRIEILMKMRRKTQVQYW